MREAYALIRASWLSATSYRLALLLSLGALAAAVVPVYFVANAIQPVIADSIQTQGGEYFAFLIVGMIAFSFLSTAVSALPGAVSGGIGSGTLEALFSTRAKVTSLVSGMIGYGFLWTAARALILILTGVLFGADFAWTKAFTAGAILLLIVLAYLPFGLLSAALVLAFRTSGPLPRGVMVLSGLLGGVYYPTKVIPSWIQNVSEVVPLTYGLRALRQTLLEGMPLQVVARDVTILVGFVIVLSAVGVWAFARALRYAKQAGNLSQY
jgi:ABC-2 type transport system permease protein